MNDKTKKQIEEIHAVIVGGRPSSLELVNAAKKVVSARYYSGQDGWDVLKNAIGELQDVLVKERV